MTSRKVSSIVSDESVKRVEEKDLRRKQAKSKTQQRKQQRKRKKEKYYA